MVRLFHSETDTKSKVNHCPSLSAGYLCPWVLSFGKEFMVKQDVFMTQLVLSIHLI